MTMPKTAVNQNHGFVFGQEQVWFAGQCLAVEPIAEPAFVETAPDDQFRARILAPDTCHHAPANFGCHHICQAVTTC